MPCSPGVGRFRTVRTIRRRCWTVCSSRRPQGATMSRPTTPTARRRPRGLRLRERIRTRLVPLDRSRADGCRRRHGPQRANQQSELGETALLPVVGRAWSFRRPASPRRCPAGRVSSKGVLEVKLQAQLHFAVRVARIDDAEPRLADLIPRIVEFRGVEAVERLETELHAQPLA